MAPTTNVAPRRVLVVDDDPALLAAIADGLQIVGGFDVIFASDGASGLERFFTAAPDCVVVDVRMPGLNGYQFVRALRGDPETAQTPIIVLSALVHGADAYLTKPVKIVDLVKSIDHAVRLTSDERQRRVRELTETAPERGDA